MLSEKWNRISHFFNCIEEVFTEWMYILRGQPQLTEGAYNRKLERIKIRLVEERCMGDTLKCFL